MAVDEQPYRLQIGLFGINSLQLALNVAPNQHGPQKELDVPCAIAGCISHAGHFIGIVTDDP